MNLESKLKAAFVAECRQAGAWARRHEDRYALGMLDMSIKFPNLPHIMVEAKLVPHQQFEPTPRQFEEGLRYEKAGGIAVLIAWDPKTMRMYVHQWVNTTHKEDSWPPDGAAPGLHVQALRTWLINRATASLGRKENG